MERNQKEAEEHLKALTTEAQQLRTRLAKLEAGIKKWQGLVNALKTSQAQAMTSTVVMPGADEAGDLEPVRTGGKSDKHVSSGQPPPRRGTLPILNRAATSSPLSNRNQSHSRSPLPVTGAFGRSPMNTTRLLHAAKPSESKRSESLPGTALSKI